MKLHRGKAADRAGYALVLFVMIFFGLMGLAALVIDMGFARLTQREMQTAVDSAALEGLRWRDVQQSADLPPAWFANPSFQEQTGIVLSTSSISLSSTQSDTVRRWAAGQVVANLFTNYPDASGGTVQYGAGPVVNFSGGVGPADLAAAQTMVVPGTPVYQPTGLQFNLSNGTAGDMSSGAYGANPNYDPNQSADEDASYNRRDFMPSSGAAPASPPAFLVRMRRTNNASGLDQEAGVSSGGPALPVLFGSGSLMARSGTGSQLSVTTGITVRATAIAAAGDGLQFGGTSGTYSAGRAKSAGRSYAIPASGNQAAVTIPGVAPFALESSFWASSSSATSSVALNLVPTSGGSPPCVEIQTSTGTTVGFLLSATADADSHVAAAATSIGQPPQLLVPNGSSAGFDDSVLAQDGTGGGVVGYVPIYTTVSLGGQSCTIIGFGYLSAGQWAYTPANQQAGQSAQLTIFPPRTLSPHVGSQNVSGTLVFALPASFSQQDVSTLFQLHAGTATGASVTPLLNSAYAPVLVNHYIGPNP
jgi:Flp pilus assembly protein TadG